MSVKWQASGQIAFLTMAEETLPLAQVREDSLLTKKFFSDVRKKIPNM